MNTSRRTGSKFFYGRENKRGRGEMLLPFLSIKKMTLAAEEGLEPPTKTFKGFCSTLRYSAFFLF